MQSPDGLKANTTNGSFCLLSAVHFVCFNWPPKQDIKGPLEFYKQIISLFETELKMLPRPSKWPIKMSIFAVTMQTSYNWWEKHTKTWLSTKHRKKTENTIAHWPLTVFLFQYVSALNHPFQTIDPSYPLLQNSISLNPTYTVQKMDQNV